MVRTRRWQTGPVRLVVSSPDRPGARIGCLGSVLSVLVVAAVVVAVLLGAIFLLAVVAAVTVIGLLALGVDRLAMAINPRYRRRRTGLERPGQVIDATASLDPPRPDGRRGEP